MKVVPASKTRYYRTENDDVTLIQEATRQGLHRYFNKVLKPMLLNEDNTHKVIRRIIMIDHSGGGGSVDGWWLAFLDSASAYWAGDDFENGDENWPQGEESLNIRDYYRDIPRFLINIVDYDRRPGGGNEAIAPLEVPLLATLTIGKSGDVNTLVGDKRSHPRLVPEYPPNSWERPIKNSWADENEESAATALKDDIIRWNKDNGGLIGSPRPKKPSGKETFLKGGKKLGG
jgi:hypothetical protein